MLLLLLWVCAGGRGVLEGNIGLTTPNARGLAAVTLSVSEAR